MDDRSPYPFVTRDLEKGEPTLGDERVKMLAYAGGTLVFLVSLFGFGFVCLQMYLDVPKTAEATNTIGQISKLQVEAYAAGRAADPAANRAGAPSLCKSAPHPVPTTVGQVKGHYYTSLADEWQDGAEDEGFRCLRFEMTEPQWFQYDFVSTGPQGSFTATAHGDRDGDGVTSTLSLRGTVDPTHRRVELAPSIDQLRPAE